MKSRQFINAFNRYSPNEFEKSRMLSNILLKLDSNKSYRRKRRIMKKIFIPIAATLALAVLFYIKLLNDQEPILNNDAIIQSENSIKTDVEAKFNGFILTAYAAEKENSYLATDYKENSIATVLTTQAKVLLAKYSPLLSSVPGLPFTFDLNINDNNALEVDNISVATDSGELLTWDTASGVVTNNGISLNCQPGDTLYWTPFITNENANLEDSYKAGEETHITVTAMKDGRKIGKQIITITETDGDYYAIVENLDIYETR